jgi:hypothetical protein
MAKQSVAVVEKTHSSLPEFLQSVAVADAGKGTSQSQEDNIVPLIYVLQSNSPAAKKNSSNHIPGAEAGDIWKRNSLTREIVPSQEGIIFQPCYFEKVWIEWRPNRGGFVATHSQRPIDAQEQIINVEGKERKAWVRTNGNLVVETRQHMGFADGEPYVIPFSSTGHTVSRTWMQMMNQARIPGSDKIAPSFAKRYKLTTIERTKDSNSWFVFKVEDAGWVENVQEYERGKALHEAFAKGEKKVEAHHDMEEGTDESPPF